MLYRTTHHPFLFSLTPFTSIPLSSSSPHLLPSSPSPLQVVEQEMEPAQRALKGGLKPVETTVFSPLVMEDLSSAVNGQTGDDFFVDDLLDFSNAVTDEPEEQKQQETPEKNEVADVKTVISNVSCTTNSPLNQDFCSLPASDLAVPADDLENLEWLSHFVEDSFSEYSLTCPATKPPPEAKKAKSEPEKTAAGVTKPVFTTLVQTKARTKRSRTGLRVWPLASPSITDSSASSSSSSSSTTSSPLVGYSNLSQAQFAESLLGKPPKKQKRKPPPADSAVGGGQQPRRCSHCGVQKTPQWRAGPLGAKTLCNACGVRFKSGRLLPEYRPACSPTFSSELHSNNHRKVLEMRQKKDVDTGLVHPVQSF